MKIMGHLKACKQIKYAYSKFRSINGNHPLKESVPDSFIEYNVRKRHGGKVAIFNFDLAKDMGLIPDNHPNEMNPDLEEIILETFSLVIINEYDLINNIKFPKEDIKSNKYMATRYLQLQHPNKKGKTSGDGRSIWNGSISHNGITWDISSCGVGATRLSPATHTQKKFFRTGDPTISYGCGYSEKDEGLASIFFSEVLHRNNIATERVLAIIEFHGGLSINVRVQKNLIRPSHIFQYLKQNNRDGLKKIIDYHMDRQISNKKWKNVPSSESEKYQYLFDRIVEDFARTTACFEDNYIFCWMDWDGDNILMNGGIIDYGSIRQFGLFHHEYRYDDDDRFSTTILEQKNKARYIVQTFAQIVDFIITGKKKSIDRYAHHEGLDRFNNLFNYQKNINLIHKIGFDHKQRDYILKNLTNELESFRKIFTSFEKAKSKKGRIKVSDGITWDAIFCMRDILRELPASLVSTGEVFSRKEFIDVIKSSYAKRKDLKGNVCADKKINEFQNSYVTLVKSVADGMDLSFSKLILSLSMRSSIINQADRITGDSITIITEKIIKHRPKIGPNEMYNILKEFVEYQNLNPDNKIEQKEKTHKVVNSLLRIVKDNREGI